jgi:hypothetical protein
MIPFGNCMHHDANGRGSSGGHGVFGQIVAAIAAVLVVWLVGRSVATALDSPMLAIVADGMLFLIGVAVNGAVRRDRP